MTNLFAVLLIVLFVFLTGRDTYRYTGVGSKIDKWMNGKTNVTANVTTTVTNSTVQPGK